MSETTSWEVELNEDVSPAARKAETALARLQKMIQRFSASGISKGMAGLDRVRDRANGIKASAMARIPGLAAATGNKFGPFKQGSFDARVQGRGVGGLLAEGIGGGISKAGGSLEKFGKKWDKFKNNAAVSKGFEFAKNAVMLTAAAAASVVAGLTVATIKMVDFGQKSRAAFSMMLGGAEAGNAAFESTRSLAKELGMNIDDVAGSYQRFLSMGFDRKEAEQLIKMGADMSALGASTEKVNSVLDAMGKIQATGTLQGDELMMLAEAGINIGAIYDRLGEKFGKTRAQIVKMKEAGKISARDAIDAIKATVLATTKQKDFGMARKNVIATTLGGGWEKLKAEVRDKMIGIADAAAPALSRALNAVNARMSTLLNGKEGAAMQGGIVAMIEWISGAIEKALPYLEDFFRSFIDGAGEALGPMMEIFRSMGASFGPDMATNIKILGKVVGQLAGVLIAASVVLGGAFFQALVSIANVINDIVAGFKWIIDNIGKVAMFFTEDSANAKAVSEYMARNGGSTAGISNSGLNSSMPNYYERAKLIPQGSAANTSNTVTYRPNFNITAPAPPGGSSEQARQWGQGVADGANRSTLRFFESANLAQGT